MILMGLRRAKVWPNKNLDCLFAVCKAGKYLNYVLFGVWNVSVWLSIYPDCEMPESRYREIKK